jgi:hypothetical protein
LQVRFNNERNLTRNLQRKFDDISNSPQDGDDNDSTPHPKKRGRRSGNTADPDEPGVEEAETDEIKRLGRRFMILHGPWLKRKEHAFEVELDEDYDKNDRFKDDNTIGCFKVTRLDLKLDLQLDPNSTSTRPRTPKPQLPK